MLHQENDLSERQEIAPSIHNTKVSHLTNLALEIKPFIPTEDGTLGSHAD
ncbi:23931_t:CDS:1, partial [Cetraspora pellucida]